MTPKDQMYQTTPYEHGAIDETGRAGYTPSGNTVAQEMGSQKINQLFGPDTQTKKPKKHRKKNKKKKDADDAYDVAHLEKKKVKLTFADDSQSDGSRKSEVGRVEAEKFKVGRREAKGIENHAAGIIGSLIDHGAGINNLQDGGQPTANPAHQFGRSETEFIAGPMGINPLEHKVSYDPPPLSKEQSLNRTEDKNRKLSQKAQNFMTEQL